MSDTLDLNDSLDLSDTGDWHEYLVEQLTDREEAIGFLHAVLEDFQLFGNTLAVMSAIESIVEAQGGIAALAKQTGVAPQTFLDVLVSDETHHCLSTLQTLLNTFGCRISIEPLMQFETEAETSPGLGTPVTEGGHLAVVAESPAP